jgi:hypothetical protein
LPQSSWLLFTLVAIFTLLPILFVVVSGNIISPRSSMTITEDILYLKHIILNRLNANGGINILDYMKEALTKNYSNYGFSLYGDPSDIEAQIDDNTLHFVMLTFYLGSGIDNDQHIGDLLADLQHFKIKHATFFIHPMYAIDHPQILKAIQDSGYIIRPWNYTGGTDWYYDKDYPPSTFQGYPLSDTALLKQFDRDYKAGLVIKNGVFSSNQSIVASLPGVMGEEHQILLETLLEENERRIIFKDLDT